MSQPPQEEEPEQLKTLAEQLVKALETTIASVLKDAPNEAPEKAAAILEACPIVAMRVVAEMGCPWQEAIWALRHTVAAVEEAHVHNLRSRMAAVVGEPKPGEEKTAAGEAEEALIKLATEYTPRSE